MFGTEALMKYLTLGYGSAWKFPNLAANDSAETTNTANSPGKDTAGQPTSGYVFFCKFDISSLTRATGKARVMRLWENSSSV